MRFYTIFLLLSLTLLSCTETKEPEFRQIRNFGLRSLTNTGARIGFEVEYYNPNGFGVNVKEAVADISLNNIPAGRFLQDSLVNVKAKSHFSIPFTGEIALKDAMKLDLRKLASEEVLLKADGTVKLGKAGVYISKPIKYEGRHRLEEIPGQ